ncbi:hypothetical protein AXF42_Ash007590 [Apostasia shenzhenica]|uniref:Uncharacterized protein n=1 Tax=Apostasia shenzhenica TaxID=1088818 RepID=A0A2I0A5W4_9ASPA|nr:hypothetical protein AXF42_Ash007590 [Apostasia shenzhenica]
MAASIETSAFFITVFFSSVLMRMAYGAGTNKPSQLIDRKTIDLGIAYVLMLAALLVTYIVH